MNYQKLPFEDFKSRFQTDEACQMHLFLIRWPDDFVCPVCGHDRYYKVPRWQQTQCKNCGHQTSVTAGTVMHRTRSPLRYWFSGIFLGAKGEESLNALQLSEKLDLNCHAARRMLHKIEGAIDKGRPQQGPKSWSMI
jgi:predicted RNA-binding Zn-ribbon protein involved in translation (DUF1610 family)